MTNPDPRWSAGWAPAPSVPSLTTPSLPRGSHRPYRRRRSWWLVGVLCVLGLLVGMGLGKTVGDRTSNGQSAHSPTPGAGEEPARVLPAVSAPAQRTAATSGYAFLHTQSDGAPVGFSPCRVWHVRVNPELGPAFGYQVVADALVELSAATGLRFVLDGQTDELPSDQRPAYQPDRYGDTWAPILIAWSLSPQPDIAGHGGPVMIERPDEDVKTYVSGMVTLDAINPANADRAALRAVMLHELGHVVGLDHVSDPTQLMAPQLSGLRNFAAGDLAGLAQVGDTPCVPLV